MRSAPGVTCPIMPSPAQPIERKLAAIFAADVAGYSRLMGQDEVGTLRTLAAHREIMDPERSMIRRAGRGLGDSTQLRWSLALNSSRSARIASKADGLCSGITYLPAFMAGSLQKIQERVT